MLSRTDVTIADEDDVVIARKKARDLAQQLGFDPFATAAIVTAASELGRNAWRHAGGGRAAYEVVEERGRVGLQLTFVDEGPGIADVEQALAGGNSTIRSLGLGLAGSKRLTDEFAIDSVPGKGTKVSLLKWKRR